MGKTIVMITRDENIAAKAKQNNPGRVWFHP